jgi:hypothetical protein
MLTAYLFVPALILGTAAALAVLFLRKEPAKPLFVVPLPVVACEECMEPFDLEEFRALRASDDSETHEVRVCHCGENVRIEHNIEQDWITQDEYREMWSHSSRTNSRVFVFDPKRGIRSV